MSGVSNSDLLFHVLILISKEIPSVFGGKNVIFPLQNYCAMKPKYFILTALFFLTMFSCQKEPCEGKMCLNEGVCVDGTCQCPDNFTGENCGEQRTPHFIRVTSVQLTRFPATNAGVSWDPSDGPDLFFKLSNDQHPIAQPIVLMENADPSLDSYFFINLIDIRHVESTHTMQLFDYDGVDADHDLLGEIRFDPYHSTNGFPTTIVLDDGGAIAFVLTFDYYFNID